MKVFFNKSTNCTIGMAPDSGVPHDDPRRVYVNSQEIFIPPEGTFKDHGGLVQALHMRKGKTVFVQCDDDEIQFEDGTRRPKPPMPAKKPTQEQPHASPPLPQWWVRKHGDKWPAGFFNPVDAGLLQDITKDYNEVVSTNRDVISSSKRVIELEKAASEAHALKEERDRLAKDFADLKADREKIAAEVTKLKAEKALSGAKSRGIFGKSSKDKEGAISKD